MHAWRGSEYGCIIWMVGWYAGANLCCLVFCFHPGSRQLSSLLSQLCLQCGLNLSGCSCGCSCFRPRLQHSVAQSRAGPGTWRSVFQVQARTLTLPLSHRMLQACCPTAELHGQAKTAKAPPPAHLLKPLVCCAELLVCCSQLAQHAGQVRLGLQSSRRAQTACRAAGGRKQHTCVTSPRPLLQLVVRAKLPWERAVIDGDTYYPAPRLTTGRDGSGMGWGIATWPESNSFNCD